jgi:hypothetical protein
MNWQKVIRVAVPLTLTAFCLFEFVLFRQSETFRECAELVLLEKGALLACLVAWCGTLLVLTFDFLDWVLVIFLILAAGRYFLCDQQRGTDSLVLFSGVTLGKGSLFLLNKGNRKRKSESPVAHDSSLINLLTGLTALLALSVCWHLDVSYNFYQGPRWMGLWNNPNTYGMIMGGGVTLGAGLLARMKKDECIMMKWQAITLCIAVGMMLVGLIMSYSRGAWLGTTTGLLYLAWSYRKLKSKYVLPGIALVLVAISLFWNHTLDSSPWFIKRADLGRPSAQHRLAAWEGGLKIMLDHPFGVGWNKAVQIYQDHYSAPEDGAAAITTNDYLMIGTQLGIPALVCFLAYVALCFKNPKSAYFRIPNAEFRINIACRSGTLAMLVAFWFDGGLFMLPTASIFWILFELGNVEIMNAREVAPVKENLNTLA